MKKGKDTTSEKMSALRHVEKNPLSGENLISPIQSHGSDIQKRRKNPGPISEWDGENPRKSSVKLPERMWEEIEKALKAKHKGKTRNRLIYEALKGYLDI